MPAPFKKLIKSLSNPYLISLILAIPISVFLSNYFPRYTSKLVSKQPVHKNDGITYLYDIDNDGFSEELLTFTDTKGHASVQIYKQDGKIKELIDFNGGLPFRGPRLIAGDYNKDKTHEIYCFYVRNDSLFFSGLSFGLKTEKFISDRFITFLGNELNVIDCSLNIYGLHDLNNDNSDELVFSVMAGFPVFPRHIYSYDVLIDSLRVSPFTGATAGGVEVCDLDQDGTKELLIETYAPANLKGKNHSGFSDTSAWLMVLDYQMNFRFPPVEFNGYTTGVSASLFHMKGKDYIGTIIRRKTYPSKPIELCVFDDQGELVGKKQVDNVAGEYSYESLHSEFYKNYYSIIDNHGVVFQYDEHLNLVRKIDKGLDISTYNLSSFDLDQDGTKENVIFTGLGNIMITRVDFSMPATLNLNAEPQFASMGIKYACEDAPQLMIQSGKSIYYLTYSMNPLFYLQFPIYLGIYFFFLGLILLVTYIQRKLLQEKYNAEKRISELQLMMIKDQLDPHFMFNAMNTINSLVVLKKPEEAQQRILGLSRLMRTMVESSGKIAQTIGKEIEFTRNYLEFQKNRYQDLFDYHIEIEQDVDMDWPVPRMVIQILVENSIKHGLIPKEKDGFIRLTIKKESSDICIILEDNGIGRAEARKKVTGSTGKGLSILQQSFEILNRYSTEKANFEVEDLFSPDNQPTGTRIKLTIPVNMNYKIYER